MDDVIVNYINLDIGNDFSVLDEIISLNDTGSRLAHDSLILLSMSQQLLLIEVVLDPLKDTFFGLTEFEEFVGMLLAQVTKLFLKDTEATELPLSVSS